MEVIVDLMVMGDMEQTVVLMVIMEQTVVLMVMEDIVDHMVMADVKEMSPIHVTFKCYMYLKLDVTQKQR